MDNKFEFKYVELASMYDEQTKEIIRLKEHIRMEDIEKNVLIKIVLRHELTIDSLRTQLLEVSDDICNKA